MARRPRFCPAGHPQHVIQRGNNRQACFASEQDLAAYAHWLHLYATKHKVSIHAWVFMTNHVHLLVTPEQSNGVSNMMQSLGRHYVRYFNHQYKRTGTLWEGRFKSCLVQTDQYLLTCQRYIELNPVRAGMVKDPADYAWSSYSAHALGKQVEFHQPHHEYLQLANSDKERQANYRGLFSSDIEGGLLTEIRKTLNKGLALGHGRFKEEIETLHKRRITPRKAGRPKRTRID